MLCYAAPIPQRPERRHNPEVGDEAVAAKFWMKVMQGNDPQRPLVHFGRCKERANKPAGSQRQAFENFSKAAQLPEAAVGSPKGFWLAQDGAHVRVGPCGAVLCATIAKPKSSVDPQTGLPWTDKNNPDPAHRGRPLIGVPVLWPSA